ncbi:MAG: hypothetical protein QOF14_2528 [Hyphomicrobiales bacterium]|nr:hypothetical protein [Hyphomicrobiales bacterium]
MRPFAFTQIVSLALLAIMSQATPASTQGFFGWFGGSQDERYPRQTPWSGHQRQYVPPQANAYSDPGPVMQERYGPASTPSISGGTGRYVAYCVRLCDGRHFPMQRHGNATSIQLCNAFCPAAKTQVFNGSAIDHATASNGARYANLENAFVYREKIVPNCTCNGKDPFGLAKIDVKADPTLRPGDIVATGDNQKAALVAAANKQARRIITEKPAALRGSPARAKAAAEPASDADERPED